jgi:hypothetical protein
MLLEVEHRDLARQLDGSEERGEPMPVANADIEQASAIVQAGAVGQKREKVGVPPVHPVITDMSQGMRLSVLIHRADCSTTHGKVEAISRETLRRRRTTPSSEAAEGWRGCCAAGSAGASSVRMTLMVWNRLDGE